MATSRFSAEMAATNAMRDFGAQNAMLVRNETPPDSFVAMLASCSNMGQLQGPRAVGGLEDAVLVGCGQKRPFLYPSFDAPAAGEEEPGDEYGSDECSGHMNVEKKRRLTFEQVRSLERNFEIENKLEPERKMQLAKELGLQPRQVAVWFQNRRARWKIKQLERDYEVLSSDYSRLKTEFEAIVQEKEKLKSEVQRLSGKNEFPGSCAADGTEPSTVSWSETAQTSDHVHDANSVPIKLESPELLSEHDLVEPDHSRDSEWRQVSPRCGTVDLPASTQSKESSVQEEQSTSAGDNSSNSSNSSEILNTESPRTIGHSYYKQFMSSATIPTNLENNNNNTYNDIGLCSRTSFTKPADSNFVQLDHHPSAALISDDLCARAPSPQIYQRAPTTTAMIKLEDGILYQSDHHHHQVHSCNSSSFLSQLDEFKAAAMPWWADWSA